MFLIIIETVKSKKFFEKITTYIRIKSVEIPTLLYDIK